MVKVDGWTVNKRKIATYVLNDKNRFSEIDDFICEDAVTFLKLHLNTSKKDLYNQVSKSDSFLNLAIIYFACGLIVMSRNDVTQNSGNVNSESLGEMSISYDSLSNNTKKLTSTEIPKDWFKLAIYMIDKYLSSLGMATGQIPFAIANLRSEMFKGSYNKEDNSYEWGVNTNVP